MQTRLPAVVADYLRRFGEIDHADQINGRGERPTISATFHPAQGWKTYPGRKCVTVGWVRRHLRPAGVTVVEVTVAGRRADFTVAEMLRGVTR